MERGKKRKTGKGKRRYDNQSMGKLEENKEVIQKWRDRD